MSIRPVDFQVMIPKTSEISKIHNDEQQKEQAVNYQQAIATQQKSHDSMHHVNSGEKTQQSGIKEKQGKNKYGKKKNKSNYGKNEETSEKDGTSIIDIRL